MDRQQHRANAKPPEVASDAHAAELLQVGLTHQRAGDLTSAESSYRQVLAARPGHPDALHLLGLVAHQRGQHELAVELIRRAIRQNGRSALALSDLGNALRNQGKPDEAAAAHRHAAQLKPPLAEALSNLGTVLRDQGKFDEALATYHQAIRIKPDYAEAHSNLGTVLRAQGKLDEAAAAHRAAVRVRPDFAEAHSSLGVALRDQGKLDEAVAAHRQAILIRPDSAHFHSNLGNALRDQGQLVEAVAAYRQAIRIDPDYAEFYSNLGNALRDRDQLDEAICAYEQAIRLQPVRAEFHLNLGIALRYQGKLDGAVAAFRQAITFKPGLVDAHDYLGIALLELGRVPECRAVWEEAVRLAPRNTKCLHNLAEIVRFVDGDPRLAAMEQLGEDNAALSNEDRVHLHFALAKAYADVGRHADAFRQWLDGNALKRRKVTYHEAATLGAMDRARAVFTPELFQRFQNKGPPSPVPIFIVGMPRSGTTLIEQILASHPQVFGGGEMKHFAAAVDKIRMASGGLRIYPELTPDMTDQDFHDLGAQYLAAIRPLAPSAMRVTDKMPVNFMFVGLIHLALPNAVIIHARRDPVDTCLSCFSKLFVEEQNHTYDLGELGRYYRGYQALMAHWHRVLPAGRILDVCYEDVVGDLEGQARRIIAHCGLEWDARCLAFHQTQRPVRTFSAAQVRQPIYSSSIGRWRPYEPFLGPLLRELEFAGGQAPAD